MKIIVELQVPESDERMVKIMDKIDNDHLGILTYVQQQINTSTAYTAVVRVEYPAMSRTQIQGR